MAPENALDHIKRWIDDEYLAFADGYDASRRYRVWCADIPSGEITQMVDDGVVLFGDGREEGLDAHDQNAEVDGGGVQEPERKDDQDAEFEEEREPQEPPPPPRDSGAGDEREGKREEAVERSPVRTEPSGGADGGAQPTPKLKLVLPRRSQLARLSSTQPNGNGTDGRSDVGGVAGNAETDQENRGGRPSTPAPVSNSVPAATSASAPSPPRSVSLPEPKREEAVGSVWTVWPAAGEGSVESR